MGRAAKTGGVGMSRCFFFPVGWQESRKTGVSIFNRSVFTVVLPRARSTEQFSGLESWENSTKLPGAGSWGGRSRLVAEHVQASMRCYQQQRQSEVLLPPRVRRAGTSRQSVESITEGLRVPGEGGG